VHGKTNEAQIQTTPSGFVFMVLAGHSSLAATHQFSLAVVDNLSDCARAAASRGIGKNLARIRRAPTIFEQKD